jgi:hypothetical protein
MKMLAFLLWMMIPFLIYRIGIRLRSPFSAQAALLWITFPAGWWCSKTTGPETFILFLCCLALYLLMPTGFRFERNGRRYQQAVAWVLLGAACGLKPTAAPVVVFVLMLALVLHRCPASALGAGLLLAALGFTAANPFILISPEAYIRNLTEAAQVAAPSSFVNRLDWAFFGRALWCGSMIIIDPGLCLWAFSIVGFAAYWSVLPLLGGLWKALIAQAACLFTAVLLMVGQLNLAGWYWVPTLVTLPATLLYGKRRGRAAHAAVGGLIALNAILNMPIIGSHLEQRWHDFRLYREHGEFLEAVESVRRENGISSRHVFDLAELQSETDPQHQVGFAGRHAACCFLFSGQCPADLTEISGGPERFAIVLDMWIFDRQPFFSLRNDIEKGVFVDKRRQRYQVVDLKKRDFLWIIVVEKEGTASRRLP